MNEKELAEYGPVLEALTSANERSIVMLLGVATCKRCYTASERTSDSTTVITRANKKNYVQNGRRK